MCESVVVLRKNKKDKLLMDEVARFTVDSNKVICYSILGDKKEFNDVIFKEANLVGHKIVLEEIA